MFFSLRAKPKRWIVAGGLAIFLSIAFSAQPCFAMSSRPKNPTSSPAIIKGQISDGITNQLIVNASVKLYTLTGQFINSALTDSYGNYFISANIASGSYLLIVSAKDYAEKTVSCYIGRAEISIFNFTLLPPKANFPPRIISFTPQERSTFTAGESIDITTEAVDPDDDKLQYRYLMDDTVIQDWSNSSTFNFKTSAQQRGKHNIKIEVKDGQGSLDTKTITIFIFRALPAPLG